MIFSQCSNYILTSESVSAGHPDKVADQISDAILDMYIAINPNVHTAIETLVTSNNVIISGEVCGVTINHEQIDHIVRQTIRNIGYEHNNFHWQTVKIQILIHEQSQDIIAGVNSINSKAIGAGDQGTMYGYATGETESLIPAPIFYAHLILKNIMNAVKLGIIPKLGPDAKSQITLVYENNIPVCTSDIIISIQHSESLSQEQVREIIHPYIASTLPKGWMCPESKFLVNPTGRFVIGGPIGDCGLTGRKIMVDSYGGHIPHGGGAFSGKDPTKVDRSAAYIARYIAKNIVAAKLASQCLVQLSYAIGVPKPLSFQINTFGTNQENIDKIKFFIQENIDLSPGGISQYLKLNKPIYQPTACYGHFGRIPNNSGNFSWEKEELSTILQKEFNTNYKCKCNMYNE